jgi:hypothetical protein
VLAWPLSTASVQPSALLDRPGWTHASFLNAAVPTPQGPTHAASTGCFLPAVLQTLVVNVPHNFCACTMFTDRRALQCLNVVWLIQVRRKSQSHFSMDMLNVPQID